jgi:hypothetical protein
MKYIEKNSEVEGQSIVALIFIKQIGIETLANSFEILVLADPVKRQQDVYPKELLTNSWDFV